MQSKRRLSARDGGGSWPTKKFLQASKLLFAMNLVRDALPAVVQTLIASTAADEALLSVSSLISASAGAMLLQVPEKALMTASMAVKDVDFAAKVLQHGSHLSQEQVGYGVMLCTCASC